MSVIGSNVLAGASGQSAGGGGGGGAAISRSLRFNASDSAYLSRTPSSAGNRKTWTWSGWVKNSSPLTGTQSFFAAGSNGFTFRISATGAIEAYEYSGGFVFHYVTSALYRDPSAWYHIILAVNTDDSTASDRIKIYVNGSRITAFATSTSPSSGATAQVNNTVQHEIGNSSTNTYFNGYLADVHFIDGQALAATDFGETNTDNLWVPKAFEGTHNATGTNYVSGTAGSPYSSGSTYLKALDGSTSTSMAAAGGSTYTVNFNTISSITTLRIFGKTVSDTGTFTVNGNDYLDLLPHHFGGSAGWVTIPETSLSQIVIGTQNSGYEDAFIYAIEVNGSVLVETPSGVNGFHLDFADNSSNAALGTDTSGNSNTWTVNNLIAVTGAAANQSQTWSSSNTGYHSGATSAFDGNLTTSSFASGGANANAYVDITAITASKVEVYISAYTSASAGGFYYCRQTDNTQHTYTIGGSGTSLGWVTVYDGSQISINRLGGARNSSGSAGSAQYGWKVDGVLLVDSGISGFATAKDIDSLVDSPSNGTQADTGIGGEVTGCYATLNPLTSALDSSGVTISNGNLDISRSGGANRFFDTTMSFSSGKWYWEMTAGSSVSNYPRIGIWNRSSSENRSNYPGQSAGSYGANRGWGAVGMAYGASGNISSGLPSFTANDVLMFAMDLDNGKLWFGKNGTWYSTGSSTVTAANIANNTATARFTDLLTESTGTSWTPIVHMNSGDSWTFNAGQRAFAYAAPSGYKSLNTASLPQPTIADGSKYFDTKLYTGNGLTNTAITGLNFNPDFVWIKARSAAYDHMLNDSVRGATKSLRSNLTDAEGTNANDLQSFDTNGFTVGYGGYVNGSGQTFASWNWDAGDTTTTIAAGGLNSSLYNQSQTWSAGITTTLLSGNPAANGFDGSSSTNAAVNASDTVMNIDFSNITVYSTIEIRGEPGYITPNCSVTVGGTTTTAGGDPNTGVAGTSGTTTKIFNVSGSLTNVKIGKINSGRTRLSQLLVDGKILVDATATPPNVPSIASTVRANPSAGFSIVKWTGNGSTGATAGHGLNATPEFIIFKCTSNAENWNSYHASLGASQLIALNSTNAASSTNDFNNTAPTNNVFSLGSGTGNNANGYTYISYCFAPVEGYSAMGSYTGNGSTDGPFVYTGFKPSFILTKRTDSAKNWFIFDSARNEYNVGGYHLIPNLSSAEGTSTDVDYLSNGFKIRNTGGSGNASGGTYIYLALASHPFASNGGLAR